MEQKGKNPRRLTPRECARLMGHPDSFKIQVSDTQAYRQFGNSVVVPVVERLALAVAEALKGPILKNDDFRLSLTEEPNKNDTLVQKEVTYRENKRNKLKKRP